MPVSLSDRLSTAAHLHVLLRRKLGRITDTEWMAANEEYALSIVRLCHQQQDEDLRTWADKLDAMYAAARPPAAKPAPPIVRPVATREDVEQRYIGRLR
jgi:hypothetical protein